MNLTQHSSGRKTCHEYFVNVVLRGMKCLRPIVAFVVHQGLYVSLYKKMLQGAKYPGCSLFATNFFVGVCSVCSHFNGLGPLSLTQTVVEEELCSLRPTWTENYFVDI